MHASSEIRSRGASSQVKDHRKLAFVNLNTGNRSRDDTRSMDRRVWRGAGCWTRLLLIGTTVIFTSTCRQKTSDISNNIVQCRGFLAGGIFKR
jgi:hypothetical protein